jgi:hypothetical protein
MAYFNASTRTSSGVNWTPGASDTLAKWLYSKSWTGQFQDWAVDPDGDLESIVWSSDGRSTLQFYLYGWSQSGSGFNATGLAFQVLDDLGGTNNRAAAFWDGNIYLSRDFKTLRGTVTEMQESSNDDNYWYASGSWDASRLYSGTPDQVISYIFAASDQITGSRFADNINSGGGDDNIAGGGGDDLIDGGAGTDKAIFSGAFSGYRFEKDSSGRIAVSDLTSGRDGRDSITGIETLAFSDREVSVSALFETDKPSSNGGNTYQVPVGRGGRWLKKSQLRRGDAHWDVKGKGKNKKYLVDNDVVQIDGYNIDKDALSTQGFDINSTMLYGYRAAINPEGEWIYYNTLIGIGNNVIAHFRGLSPEEAGKGFYIA